jgi:membrane protein DedA with SNARE-associated domain
MGLLEQGINWLQHLPWQGVLALMFLIAYVENIFPPSPSDVLLVFAGTLIGLGTIGFTSSLLFSTLGSTLGFMTAYALGRYFERHVVEGRFGRYLPVSTIAQAERLFQRFGYGVIIANRFLAGTRAIVSFAAGMSRMNLPATTALSAVSAALWNSILLTLGMLFGRNWQRVGEYLSIYSTVVTVIVIVVAAVYLRRYLRNRRQAPAATDL